MTVNAREIDSAHTIFQLDEDAMLVGLKGERSTISSGTGACNTCGIIHAVCIDSIFTA